MKKKLYLDNINSVGYFGEIHFDFRRLYKYIGFNFTDLMFSGTSKIKEEILNDKIEFKKLTKSEKIDLNTDCNYEVISNKLSELAIKRSYIKFNLFERIKYHFTERPSDLLWLIGLIATIVFFALNYIKPQDQSNNPSDTKNKTRTNTEIQSSPLNSPDSLRLDSIN